MPTLTDMLKQQLRNRFLGFSKVTGIKYSAYLINENQRIIRSIKNIPGTGKRFYYRMLREIAKLKCGRKN